MTFTSQANVSLQASFFALEMPSEERRWTTHVRSSLTMKSSSMPSRALVKLGRKESLQALKELYNDWHPKFHFQLVDSRNKFCASLRP